MKANQLQADAPRAEAPVVRCHACGSSIDLVQPVCSRCGTPIRYKQPLYLTQLKLEDGRRRERAG